MANNAEINPFEKIDAHLVAINKITGEEIPNASFSDVNWAFSGDNIASHEVDPSNLGMVHFIPNGSVGVLGISATAKITIP